tara:strand:- start:825 stop:959 length:135 start_codon:yes stop_codon:yes gene_type:complete
MRKLSLILSLAGLIACGDKNEDTGDTGDTGTEDTGAEESTAGDE